jgi:hypothetical protein
MLLKSWVAERLVAPQKEFNSMELVGGLCVMYNLLYVSEV